MLNLVNLLNTLLITTGLAAASPVCDNQKTPKQKPFYTSSQTSQYVNTYSIDLEPTNKQSSTYSNEIVNNTNITPTASYDANAGLLRDQRTNINGGNAYLNILGNEYTTLVQQGVQTYINNQQTAMTYPGTLYQNWYNLYNNNDNYYKPTTRKLIVLQITPYNYNIDNEITLDYRLNIRNPFFYYGTGYNTFTMEIEHLLYRTSLYQSTNSGFANFVGMQIVKNTTQNIIDEIEDVDNGFYYSKDTKLEFVSDQPSNYEYTTLDFEISIVPKETNYVVIDVMPVLSAIYQESDNVIEWGNIPTIMDNNPTLDEPFLTENMVITGTNIIPSGTYEVIDIPGLMWEILTMPFAFVSQAFNLTLFPGTPFQINIANLFLSVLAIFVFIFLVSLIVKLAGSAV